jgi:colanic acid/amylovoran biosynthesis glycosyltransferase
VAVALTATSPAAAGATTGSPPLVGYVMSRFPKLSETFVLFEMIAMERAGVPVLLCPLARERAPVHHPEAEPWMRRMHVPRLVSPAVLGANVAALVRRPRLYLSTLALVARRTFGHRKRFLGGLVAFVKAVRLAGVMERAGVEHVHCHFANHPAVAGLVIARLTGIPFSFTAHGSDLHKDQRMLADKVAAARFVVTISEFNAEVIRRVSDPAHHDRIHVVHCGVDTADFAPREGGPRTGPLRVICVGTLHEVKGQAVLLEACALARAAGTDVDVVLVGDGEDRAALERRATELGITGQVTFVGSATRPEVIEHLRDADVLVAPSVPTASGRKEGIPVALMEGMACGLPVVASRLTGIPELVADGRSGLLTEPGDAAALAGALGRLAGDDGLRARLGAAARRTVEDEFDLAGNARRLAELIGSEAS